MPCKLANTAVPAMCVVIVALITCTDNDKRSIARIVINAVAAGVFAWSSSAVNVAVTVDVLPTESETTPSAETDMPAPELTTALYL